MQTTIDLDHFLNRRKTKSFYIKVLIVCGLLAAIEAMDVYVLGAILVPLSEGLGVSMAAIGLVFSFQAIGQIIGTYLVAPYADKVREKAADPMVHAWFRNDVDIQRLFPESEGLYHGAHRGFYFHRYRVPCIFSMVSELASGKNRHGNTLVVGSFHGIGAGLAGLVGGFLLHYGWHVPLICVGIMDLFSVVLTYFFMPESIRFLAADAKRKDEFQSLIVRIDPSIDPQSVKIETVEGQVEKTGAASLFCNGRWRATLLLWIIGGICLSILGLLLNGRQRFSIPMVV